MTCACHRYDDNAGEDEDGDGIPDEVEDVCACFWEHTGLISNLWTYYACLGGALNAVTLNAFTRFTEDAGLIVKTQKRK